MEEERDGLRALQAYLHEASIMIWNNSITGMFLARENDQKYKPCRSRMLTDPRTGMQRVAKTGRGSIGEREGAPATEGEIERVCTAYRLFLHRVEAASSRPTCANRLFYFAIRRSLFRLTFGTVRTVR